MKITDLSDAPYLEKGKKGKGDWILRLNLNKGTAPTYLELGFWISLLAANEDRMYPRSKGFRGKNYLKDYLCDVIDAGMITPAIKKKYKL